MAPGSEREESLATCNALPIARLSYDLSIAICHYFLAISLSSVPASRCVASVCHADVRCLKVDDLTRVAKDRGGFSGFRLLGASFDWRLECVHWQTFAVLIYTSFDIQCELS